MYKNVPAVSEIATPEIAQKPSLCSKNKAAISIPKIQKKAQTDQIFK